MNARGQALYAEADRQITALRSRLVSLGDPSRFRQPCPGREKLGDGSVAAICTHVADIYLLMAAFVRTGEAGTPGPHRHGDAVDVATVVTRLATGLHAISILGGLDDTTLSTVPNAGAVRFADGDRSLEQVLTALLRHQGHQVAAVLEALSDDM